MIDLSPYIAKGFPGDLDAAIANVGVRGIDREQSLGMVRLCAQTEETLYGPEYSARHIRYQKGSRPTLEKIAAGFHGTPRERALGAMQWVYENVAHPHIFGPTAPDRALSEEALIETTCGWCNEQTRVFIGLCEVMEIPARLCFINHSNARCGHTTAEVFLDNRWVFFDVTFNLVIELPDGRLAEARELSGEYRDLAHAAYRPLLERHYERIHPFVEEMPGWRRADRPDIERGGDLMDTIGICNYLIDGVEAIST